MLKMTISYLQRYCLALDMLNNWTVQDSGWYHKKLFNLTRIPLKYLMSFETFKRLEGPFTIVALAENMDWLQWSLTWAVISLTIHYYPHPGEPQGHHLLIEAGWRPFFTKVKKLFNSFWQHGSKHREETTLNSVKLHGKSCIGGTSRKGILSVFQANRWCSHQCLARKQKWAILSSKSGLAFWLVIWIQIKLKVLFLSKSVLKMQL